MLVGGHYLVPPPILEHELLAAGAGFRVAVLGAVAGRRLHLPQLFLLLSELGLVVGLSRRLSGVHQLLVLGDGGVERHDPLVALGVAGFAAMNSPMLYSGYFTRMKAISSPSGSVIRA